MTKDCTDDFVVEDEEQPSAKIRLSNNSKGPGPSRGNRHSSRSSSWGLPSHRGAHAQAGPGGPGRKSRPAPTQKQPISDAEPLDPHRLAQRQKQVEFGKNTLGYQRYLQLKPKATRKITDPQTPDVHSQCSKRAFDGQIRVWRKQMHMYDDDAQAAQPAAQAAVDAMEAVIDEVVEEGDVPEEEGGAEDSREGSFDGYYLSSRRGVKRGHNPSNMTPPIAPGHDASMGPPFPRAHRLTGEDGPQPKRSTGAGTHSRSMDAMLMSTGSNPPRATAVAIVQGPTSFAGLGLASKVTGGIGGLPKVEAVVSKVGAAEKGASAEVSRDREGMVDQEEKEKSQPAYDPFDNVVAMILGDGASNMSWASEGDSRGC